MPRTLVRVRTVESLASALKKDVKTVRVHLKTLGVVIVDGCYDHVRYEAALNEPNWLRNKRTEWSLSHSSGLGAIKYLLDPLKINIVAHECRGSQYLMLRGPSGSRTFCKVYYTGSLLATRTKQYGYFHINNFLRNGERDVHTHYMCVSFEGPFAWVLSKTKLADTHAVLSGKGHGTYHQELTIAAHQQDREHGGVRAMLDVENSKWLLKSAKQLDL
jgi:hypothetical protein